jgi:hypothetical protein
MVPIPIFLSSFYSMYVLYSVALPHSLAGEGAGSPKSYDNIVTLVPVLIDNIHFTYGSDPHDQCRIGSSIRQINADQDPDAGFEITKKV